jgi:hypothetical protein
MVGFKMSRRISNQLTDVLADTSILERHFYSCLIDDLETFTTTLEEIQKQHPSLNFIQPSTALAAYEQQPLIFKYCLSHGASLDQSVEKAIRTPINPSVVPLRLTQPREWSIPFLDALYEIDWERIQSSRKALGNWLQPRFSPEVIAWFFDHGAEIGPGFFTHMSHFPVPAATVQDLLERTGIAHFRHSGVLQRAAGRGETDVVKILLDAGAAINEGPFGSDGRESGPRNAIFEAVKGQHIETTRLLLNRGAETRLLYATYYSSAPRTLAGRQVGDMDELLSLHRVSE